MSKKKEKKVMENEVKEELVNEEVQIPETEEKPESSEETTQDPPKKKLSKWVKIGIGAAVAAVGLIVSEVVKAAKGQTSDEDEGDLDGSLEDSEGDESSEE